jgi:hypothetical protein
MNLAAKLPMYQVFSAAVKYQGPASKRLRSKIMKLVSPRTMYAGKMILISLGLEADGVRALTVKASLKSKSKSI